MTRKDYVKFADILKTRWATILDEDLPSPRQVFSSVVDDIGDIFEADNPNFDRDRFESVVFG